MRQSGSGRPANLCRFVCDPPRCNEARRTMNVGSLDPFETARRYLDDRHRRRQDRAYREREEERGLESFENELREIELIERQLELARANGLSESLVRPLLARIVEARRRKNASGGRIDVRSREGSSSDESSSPATEGFLFSDASRCLPPDAAVSGSFLIPCPVSAGFCSGSPHAPVSAAAPRTSTANSMSPQGFSATLVVITGAGNSRISRSYTHNYHSQATLAGDARTKLQLLGSSRWSPFASWSSERESELHKGELSEGRDSFRSEEVSASSVATLAISEICQVLRIKRGMRLELSMRDISRKGRLRIIKDVSRGIDYRRNSDIVASVGSVARC